MVRRKFTLPETLLFRAVETGQIAYCPYNFIHRRMNRGGKFSADRVLTRLYAQYGYFASEFEGEKMCQDGKWHGMGGCTHSINGIQRNPSDRAWQFAHLGSIDKQNQFGLEGAYLAGVIFGSRPAFDDKQVRCVSRMFIIKQCSRHHQPRGVVSAQITANANQAGSGEPCLGMISLASMALNIFLKFSSVSSCLRSTLSSRWKI